MSAKKKSGKKKKIWIIVIVVVVIGVLIGVNLGSQRKIHGTWVDVEEVERDSLQQTVAASGKIQPTVDINVSADLAGRIVHLGAEEGDRVERGQLLVRIEDESYVATLEQFQYSLRYAEASLAEARSILRRTEGLHSNDLASDAQLESAQAAVARLEAEVDRARANVDQAEDNLSKTCMYAPISGTVTRLNKEEGEMAMGAQFSMDVIMVISQLDAMEVNVEVNENDVVLINTGDDVTIEVFAIPDTSFRGVVTEIAHSGIVRGAGTAEEVTNFEVKVAILDQVIQLRPGMSATVEIVTERRENSIVVPQEAVAVRVLEEEQQMEEDARQSERENRRRGNRDDENHFSDMGAENQELSEVVFIVENDTAWVREVRLGIYSDTHFEILEGLNEGETIVTGPFRLLSRELHGGMRVEFDQPEDESENGNAPEAEDTTVASAAG